MAREWFNRNHQILLMRILLAEDSPIYQQLIGSYLKQWGFEIVLARDGVEAWKLLKEPGAPTMALLDWVLPNMDGVELCRKIRGRGPNEAYVYTVLLTAKNDRKDLVRAMEAGADDYLVKPFDADELRARLFAGKRLLDLHKQLLSAQDSLRFAATHDFLTSLWNRAEIISFLERELIRAQREVKPVGIVLLDVDHFKQINDSLGHRCGDIVLRELGQRLRSHLRGYDGVGRYGGEEFLLILPGCDLEGALARTNDIRKSIASSPLIPDVPKALVTVSMGVTVADWGASDLALLLHRADLALYQAKNKGRNRVEPAVIPDSQLAGFMTP
jgi:two-component system, cell cycle response regulator